MRDFGGRGWFVVFLLAGAFISTTPAHAALYQPGATLDPACAPTDANCGVLNNVGTGTANQVPYYAGSGNTLTATSTLTISSNGHVGVGTTTPGTIFGIGTTGINTISLSNTATSTFGHAIRATCFTTNGTTCFSASPGGSTGQIQYNNAGNFTGAAALHYDSAHGRLGIGTSSPYAPLAVTGQVVGSYFTGTGTATSTFASSVNLAANKSLYIGGIPLLSSPTTGGSVGNVVIGASNSVATGGSGFQTAIGNGNTTKFTGATAVGYNNTASEGSNIFSTAVGNDNISTGFAASAFGSGNKATNNYSNAFGDNNTVTGSTASAFGSHVTNAIANSVMVGPSNTAKLTILSTGETKAPFFTATSTTATSTFTSGVDIGSGNAYFIGGTNALSLSSPNDNLTVGAGNSATNLESTAVGYGNGATNLNSTAVGYKNSANAGQYASAFGSLNTAAGADTLAAGYKNTASAGYTTAVGNRNGATTTGATAIGYWNWAGGGQNSSALGVFNTAEGTQASALGYNNTATAAKALAVGNSNTVTGGSALAFGYFNKATAVNATAIGTGITNAIANSLQIGPSNTAKLTILSTGETQAPFFTATSTTATSTFNGGVDIGANTSYAIAGVPILSGGLSGNTAVGVGSSVGANGSPSYGSAVGYKNSVTGTGGVAVGYQNSSQNIFATAVGTNNTVKPFNGSAFGSSNTITQGSGAFGNNNAIDASGASAFGSDIKNTIANSLMLGPSNTAKLTILSSGETEAPYFTATSTTATSTFNGFTRFPSGISAAPNISVRDGIYLGLNHSYSNVTGVNTFVQATGSNIAYNAEFNGNYGATSDIGLNVAGDINAIGITNAYGVNIGNLSGATNGYGVYIADQTSTHPNHYAIYSAGGKSYFGGNVGIGTTSPYAKLSVVGNVVASSFTATSTTATSTFNGPLQISASHGLSMSGSPVFSYNNGFSVGLGNSTAGGGSVGAAAFGNSNTASGFNAQAFGQSNIASQTFASAFGFSNEATSSNASAMGYHNVAGGSNSTAVGYYNTATAFNSSAFGSNITNNTINSTQIGPSNTAKLTIASSGNVGIGTTSPAYPLEIAGTSFGGQYGFAQTWTHTGVPHTLASYFDSSGGYIGTVTNDNFLIFTNNGNAQATFATNGYTGIGTSSPATLFEVGGSAVNVTFDAYKNCSGFTTNANGLLSCTASDERLKQDITPLNASTTLADIAKLNPVSFYWKPGTKRGDQKQLGLVAQQVQKIFPNLVSTTSATSLTPDGTLTLNYSGLISPLVAGVQTLYKDVTSLSGKVAGFAHELITQKVQTDELCVGTTCINQAQLAQILKNQNGNPSTGTIITTTPTSHQPLSVSLVGPSTMQLSIGSTYVEQGATVSGGSNASSTTYQIYVNGSTTATSSPWINTGTAGTYRLTYAATDSAGENAQAVRTVIVGAGADGTAGAGDSSTSSPATTTPTESNASSTPPVQQATTTPPTSNASSTPPSNQNATSTDSGTSATLAKTLSSGAASSTQQVGGEGSTGATSTSNGS